MAKKYGIQKETTIVRLHNKDFTVIADLALLHGCSLADATHELIEKALKKPQISDCNKATQPIINHNIWCAWCKGWHDPEHPIIKHPELDADGRPIPE